MDTIVAASPPHESVPEWLGDVQELLAEVRAPGFRIGIREEIRVTELIARIGAAGIVLRTAEEVAAWLSPIVCTTPAQQEQFRDVLLERSRRHAPRSKPTSDEVQADPTQAGPDEPRRLSRVGSIAIVLVMLTLLVIAMYWWGMSGGERAPTPEVQQQVQLQKGPLPTAMETYPGYLGRLLFLLPFFAACAWVGYERRRKAQLARRFAVNDPSTRQAWFDHADGPFSASTLSSSFQALRRHHEVPSNDIDVARTVRATVRRAGFADIRYGTRRRLPDYLLLVDRVSTRDHVAALAERLIERFERELVPVSTYDFHADPRRCRRRGRDGVAGQIAELRDLLALYGEHPVILFTDARGLFSPYSHVPQPWVHVLRDCVLTVIMTPRPQHAWGQRERRLQALGFVVLPANSEAVGSLSQLVQSGDRLSASIVAERSGNRENERVIWDDSDRWLSNNRPADDVVAQLMEALRGHLELATFQVFCAVALFPAMHPGITLRLGMELRDDRGARMLDESGLGALSRLPWMRIGRMPDWLRMECYHALPPALRKVAREIYVRMLFHPRDSGDGRFALEDISLRDEPRWLALLLDFLTQRPDSRLHDQLFLSFMRGKEPPPLAVDPGKLREMLRRHLRLTDALVLAGGLALSGIAWLAEANMPWAVSTILEWLRAAAAWVARYAQPAAVAFVCLGLVVWHAGALPAESKAMAERRDAGLGFIGFGLLLGLASGLSGGSAGHWAPAFAAIAAMLLFVPSTTAPKSAEANDWKRLFNNDKPLSSALAIFVAISIALSPATATVGIETSVRLANRLLDMGLQCAVAGMVAVLVPMAIGWRRPGVVPWKPALVGMSGGVFLIAALAASLAHLFEPLIDDDNRVPMAFVLALLPPAALWGMAARLGHVYMADRAAYLKTALSGATTVFLAIAVIAFFTARSLDPPVWVIVLAAVLGVPGPAIAVVAWAGKILGVRSTFVRWGIAVVMLLLIALMGILVSGLFSGVETPVMALFSGTGFSMKPGGLAAVVLAAPWAALWLALRILYPNLWLRSSTAPSRSADWLTPWLMLPGVALLGLQFAGVYVGQVIVPIAAWLAARYGMRAFPAFAAGCLTHLFSGRIVPAEIGFGGSGSTVACALLLFAIVAFPRYKSLLFTAARLGLARTFALVFVGGSVLVFPINASIGDAFGISVGFSSAFVLFVAFFGAAWVRPWQMLLPAVSAVLASILLQALQRSRPVPFGEAYGFFSFSVGLLVATAIAMYGFRFMDFRRSSARSLLVAVAPYAMLVAALVNIEYLNVRWTFGGSFNPFSLPSVALLAFLIGAYDRKGVAVSTAIAVAASIATALLPSGDSVSTHLGGLVVETLARNGIPALAIVVAFALFGRSAAPSIERERAIGELPAPPALPWKVLPTLPLAATVALCAVLVIYGYWKMFGAAAASAA